MSIYTVGHSTLSQEDFLLLIKDIDTIIDIRSHPTSKWPQFWQENMVQWLAANNKGYIWEPGLGGWDVRHSILRDEMSNHGVILDSYLKGKFPKQTIAKDRLAPTIKPEWTNQGLYDYSWFMTLNEFFKAADRIITLGKTQNIAILCCEVLWWKCHRSMVSDYLVYKDIQVTHLQPKITDHKGVLGNRIERYHPDIIKSWQEIL